MKTFVYQGYDGQGIRTRGIIEANDLKDARDKLSRSGVFPETVEAATAGGKSRLQSGRRHSLNVTENRAEFYRAASTLLNAGLPIESTLDLLLQQPSGNSLTAGDIAGVRDLIRDGNGMAESMLKSNIAISPFEEAVIESGEKTGNMAEVFEQVAEYLDDVSRINQNLRTACVYPAVIIVTAFIVCIGVLGFLVPQMAGVFEEAGLELPKLTIIVTAIGRYFLPVILPIVLILSAAVVTWFRRMTRNEPIRIRFESAVSRLPIVRSGYELLVVARFSRTLAMLLNGGLSLIESFILSARATGSAWVANVCKEKAESIRHGEAFHEAIAGVPMLGPALSSWAKAGEASGDLSGLMTHASKRYHQLWANYVQRMMSIVEPALIIAVAVFVLLVALAILMPILSLNQQLV